MMRETLSTIIDPALRILPPMMTSRRAKAMMLARWNRLCVRSG